MDPEDFDQPPSAEERWKPEPKKVSAERRAELRENPRDAKTWAEKTLVCKQRLTSVLEAQKLLRSLTPEIVRADERRRVFRDNRPKIYKRTQRFGPVQWLGIKVKHACTLDDADAGALGTQIDYLLACVKSKEGSIKDVDVFTEDTGFCCVITSHNGWQATSGVHWSANLAVIDAFLQVAEPVLKAKIVEYDKNRKNEGRTRPTTFSKRKVARIERIAKLTAKIIDEDF